MPAMTFSRPTKLVKRRMRSATSSGCSTTLVAWLTTPGMRILPCGKFDLFPDPPLVLVARVGGLDQVGANADLQQQADDIFQRQIRRVRPMPAAPADMVAHALLRNIRQRMVERLDARCGELAVQFGTRAGDLPHRSESPAADRQSAAKIRRRRCPCIPSSSRRRWRKGKLLRWGNTG